MAKRKVAYVCTQCGADFPKRQGQCAACGEWNTLSEFVTDRATPTRSAERSGFAGEVAVVKRLDEIELADTPRITTGITELDRVLGGGLVPGSAILIGGHPGAGKSTLLLQVMCHLAQSMASLYVTGEESLQQVAMRAQRLQLPTGQLKLLAETDVHELLDRVRAFAPKVLVVDSIQVLYDPELTSAPGSVAQVRDCAAMLTRYAKQTATVLFLVGHVTKDGSLAGPKVLEHMIDCSIMLEGSNDSRFRTLRGQKNRFGAVNELGVFAMTEHGLREVKNHSAIILTRGMAQAAGSVVMVVWESTRPLLVEIQELVATSQLSNPKRLAVGVERQRLAMVLAVLHRHGGLQLGDQDVFITVAGGVKALETSADLALVLASVSRFRDRPLAEALVLLGGVGPSGDIRAVARGQER